MNRLVALAMLTTIIAQVLELVRDDLSRWRSVTSLMLTLAAVGLAGARTVRNAARLGRQMDDAAAQSRLARLILRDHLVCASAIFVVLLLQLLPDG